MLALANLAAWILQTTNSRESRVVRPVDDDDNLEIPQRLFSRGGNGAKHGLRPVARGDDHADGGISSVFERCCRHSQGLFRTTRPKRPIQPSHIARIKSRVRLNTLPSRPLLTMW